MERRRLVDRHQIVVLVQNVERGRRAGHHAATSSVSTSLSWLHSGFPSWAGRQARPAFHRIRCGRARPGASRGRWWRATRSAAPPRTIARGGLGHRLDVGDERRAAGPRGTARRGGGCVTSSARPMREGLPRGGDSARCPRRQPHRDWSSSRRPIGRTGRRGKRVRLEGGRQPLPARTELRRARAPPRHQPDEATPVQGAGAPGARSLAHLGCPVVGDDVYGPPSGRASLRLHALAVTLRHPVTGRPLHIEAPLPGWAVVPSAETSVRENTP